MRLYSLLGASQIVTEGWAIDQSSGLPVLKQIIIDPDDDGAFDVQPPLSDHLAGLHLNSLKAWENDAERQARLDHEEAARRKDPATLLAAVESRGDNSALLAAIGELVAVIKGQNTPATDEQRAAAVELIGDAAPELPALVLPELAPADPTPTVTTDPMTSSSPSRIVTGRAPE